MKLQSFSDIEKEAYQELDDYKIKCENQFIEDLKGLAKEIIKQNGNVRKFNDSLRKSFANISNYKACEIVKNMGFSVIQVYGEYYLCKGVEPIKKDVIKAVIAQTDDFGKFIWSYGVIFLVLTSFFVKMRILFVFGVVVMVLPFVEYWILYLKHITIQNGIFVLKFFKG